MVFESLKRRLHEKFQREIIKVNVDGEDICLKKTGYFIKDYERVYPPVSEDGKEWNVKVLLFGSKKNFARTTLLFILVILGILAFKEYTDSLTRFLQQPDIRLCIEQLGYNITRGGF